jgi:hypothetical protein
MEIKNTYNGGADINGPKTPEKDKLGNTSVEKDDDPKTSGDSQPQQGENVVNAQEQNDVVNGQDGTGAEEFVDSANANTEKANTNPTAKVN